MLNKSSPIAAISGPRPQIRRGFPITYDFGPTAELAISSRRSYKGCIRAPPRVEALALEHREMLERKACQAVFCGAEAPRSRRGIVGFVRPIKGRTHVEWTEGIARRHDGIPCVAHCFACSPFPQRRRASSAGRAVVPFTATNRQLDGAGIDRPTEATLARAVAQPFKRIL